MKYNPRRHNRRSMRLKGYDYSRTGLYFITICCQNRLHLFGHIELGNVVLNSFGAIIKEEWEQTPHIRNNTALHEYIIMPNHFHAIIEILFLKQHEKSGWEVKNKGESGFKSPSQTIGAIIRGFKGATTKRIKKYIWDLEQGKGELQFAPTGIAPTGIDLSRSIWQRNYYEHIIRNKKSHQIISKYIRNNPVNWRDDRFYKN